MTLKLSTFFINNWQYKDYYLKNLEYEKNKLAWILYKSEFLVNILVRQHKHDQKFDHLFYADQKKSKSFI